MVGSKKFLYFIICLNFKCIDLVKQENISEAINALDKALKKITLSDFNNTAVIRLKKYLESQGQTFKYDITELKKKVCNYN